MPTLDQITKQELRALIPPPRLRLSEWIGREIVLPDGVSALPGPVRLWPFQREIADAIGDAEIERVTLVKPVRVLFMDEADGMESTAEGSPILLAERRTMSFPDRKIVLGSTPVHDETSHVLRAYAKSDARIYEVPCPECGVMSELLWPDIVWDAGAPETARWRCPHCAAEVSERHKPDMVAAGAWRATRPEVRGHAGFRMNALISLHSNAAWGKLAVEFVQAKDDPTTLQTFVNTILGQGWRSAGDELAEDELMARAEPFGLAAVPAEVLAVTVGVDVQHDRLEVTYLGWNEGGVALVLGHRVIWGQYDAEETWVELDGPIGSRFPHALGGKIGVDACAIDAGDGVSMHHATAFATPRTRRKVLAIKGAPGNRPMIERAGSTTKTGARLWIIGVDTVKGQLFGRLAQAGSFRFSSDLPPVWFEQLASERSVVRYTRGQPTRSFVRIPGRRAEALDCVVDAFAARALLNLDYDQRRADLSTETAPAPKRAPVLASSWMKR